MAPRIEEQMSSKPEETTYYSVLKELSSVN